MKKRIGILTFTCANNYGAILQNHALDAWLNGHLFDYNAITINYVSKDIRRNHDPKAPVRPPFKSARDKILFLWRWFNGMRLKRTNEEKDRRFYDFKEKYLHLSKEINDKNELKVFCESLDTLISGSDQVLNPFITLSDWDVYSLALFNNVRKVGYATSAGSSKRLSDDIVSAIRHFDALSVRERELMDNLETRGVESTLVCDPVVLMPQDFWSVLADKGEKKMTVRYILVYLADELSTACALRLRKLTGLPIACLGFSSLLIGKAHFIKDAGPLEFVRLVRDAEFVVTSSFHAVAFSVIFEKKFFCTAPDARGSRVPDFVHEIGIDSALVHSVDEIVVNPQYPWCDVGMRITMFRKLSEAWLEKAVE